MNGDPNTYVIPVKSIFSSKTLYLNLLGLAILIVGYVLDSQQVLHLPAHWVEVLTFTLGVLNIINRFFTYQPVEMSPSHAVLRAKDPTDPVLRKVT